MRRLASAGLRSSKRILWSPIGCSVIAAVLLFASGNARETRASIPDVQTFTKADIGWVSCYGSPPVNGSLTCPGTTSSVITTPGAILNVYDLIKVPQGSRDATAVTYTPGDWIFSNGLELASPGTVVEDVSAQVDLLCDAGASGSALDIFAAVGSSPPPSGAVWPASYYYGLPSTSPPNQISSVAPTGVNAYINSIKPTPPTVPGRPPLFTPLSYAQTSFANIYLNGTSLFYLPVPIPLHTIVEESTLRPGLKVAFSILGDASDPDKLMPCLDTPDSRVVRTTRLTAPAAPGFYPRWTMFTSSADVRSGAITRILEMHCVTVGTPLAGDGSLAVDNDHDCVADDVDPNPGNADADNDGVPDGIELAMGSDPNGADADADGATDFEELAQFTDPNNPDTDGDGSKDKQDTGADEDAPATPASVLDTTADDNCPGVYNPDQANSDSSNDYRITPSPEGKYDTTNPHQDTMGDACDPDDDNDGLLDFSETNLLIKAHGSPVTWCVLAGIIGGDAPLVAMDPLNPDSDKDLGLDGIECAQGTRPDDPSSAQRLPVGNATVDPDQDQLFIPGYADSHGNDVAELQYHTYNINKPGGGAENNPDSCAEITPPTAAQCDTNALDGRSDPDSDNDGLRDGIEVRYYGTNPVNADTDGDGCTDGVEAADVNGDRTVGAADLGGIANTTVVNPSGHAGIFGAYRNTVVNEYTTGPVGAADPRRVNYDFNKDGTIGAADLGGVGNALVFKSCAASTGSATSNQQGLTITNITKLPTDP